MHTVMCACALMIAVFGPLIIFSARLDTCGKLAADVISRVVKCFAVYAGVKQIIGLPHRALVLGRVYAAAACPEYAYVPHSSAMYGLCCQSTRDIACASHAKETQGSVRPKCRCPAAPGVCGTNNLRMALTAGKPEDDDAYYGDLTSTSYRGEMPIGRKKMQAKKSPCKLDQTLSRLMK